jgi:hypothetical protein
MSTAALPYIERLQFLDGQTLVAPDLDTFQSALADYRALHVRYLHRTWGIIAGFGVAVSATLNAVMVKPGYAVDAGGRDVLILGESVAVTPKLATPQMLLLVATSAGLCEWWSPLAVTIGAGVPLCAAYVDAGIIKGALDLSVRRRARSFALPRLATGSTGAGHTGWSDSPGPGRWIEATVDTTDAGFVHSPQYFASLNPPEAQVYITASGPQSFTARIIGNSPDAKQAESQNLVVSWVGIESGVLL